jgi:hypothetical protein
MSDTSSAVKFYEHPQYCKWKDKWETYRDLFEGDHEVLVTPKYLWPYELESSEEPATGRNPLTGAPWTIGQKVRLLRTRRSRYLNLFEPIVSTWISMAFSKPLVITPKVRDMFGDAELNDVDGERTSLENFIKNKIALAYFRDGTPYVFVDAPGSPDGESQFANKLKEREAGFRPFMEMLGVLDVPDWQLATEGPRAGKLDALRYSYRAIAPRRRLTEEPKLADYCKLLEVTPDGRYVQTVYRLEGDNWVVEKQLPVTGWDEIPVATVEGNEPWVKEIAELQLLLHNYISGWSNLINASCFQKVFFVIPGATENHKVAVSEYAYPILPDGSDVKSVNSADVTAHTEAIAWTVNQMYRVAFNRTRGLSDNSLEAPGADTLREMNAELADLLKVALVEIEGVANQAINFYARFKGQADFQSDLKFDTDLSPEDMTALSEMFLTYRDEIRKILAWRKAHLKKVALKEKFDDEDTKAILKEIDALKQDPVPDPLAGFGPFVKGADGGREQQGPEGEKPAGADQASVAA